MKMQPFAGASKALHPNADLSIFGVIWARVKVFLCGAHIASHYRSFSSGWNASRRGGSGWRGGLKRANSRKPPLRLATRFRLHGLGAELKLHARLARLDYVAELWAGIRCRRSAALERTVEPATSYNWAQRTHRSAIRVHTALFSRLRVNLAMSSHSAANRRNFSDGSMGWAFPVLVLPDQQNPNTFKMFRIEIEFLGQARSRRFTSPAPGRPRRAGGRAHGFR